ncbi:MAG: argininosuccinate lyase [Candidatus Thermoplasmatota archaeon]|nr:argininosuccinate lyase [Candidatus Thermoplasmatota archaeon]
MKLWEKKYTLHSAIESYTVGDDYVYDQQLVPYDCLGSIAHATMLQKLGIVSEQECLQLHQALHEILTLHEQGEFKIKQEDEDCHTAIENFLIKKVGAVGKKIHTGRSRNDQILTALRLYYKDQIQGSIMTANDLIDTLTKLVNSHGTTALPGYTHMRKAMPSSIGLWAGAFIESMKDNTHLLMHVNTLIDQCPAGTGAGYGVPLPIDRTMIAKLLGFQKPQENSIYVQNSRGKFESSLLHAFTQIMIDLNKMASDLLLFSMPEMGFVSFPAEFCTGSSIMPQKMNLDVLELTRAHYHQMVSWEMQIKTMSANLISGYNRDLQLIKEPVMKGCACTKESIEVMTLLIKNIKIQKDACEKAMTSDLYATDKVYELVKKGVPFRDAYRQIARQYSQGV